MSIARRILILTLVPAFALLGLAGWIVAERFSIAAEMARLANDGAIIRPLDSFVLTTVLLILAAIAGIMVCGLKTMRSIGLSLSAVAETMTGLASSSLQREAETKALVDLEGNLTAFREMLYAHGSPRRTRDGLYFGDYRVDNSNEIVDGIQARYGGAATIFLGDVRVATNILAPDGSRAIGTTLAAGAAYDAVLKNAKTYQGEAKIFNESYVTVYEPILQDKEVIGILFVGVVKKAVALIDTTHVQSEVDKMQIAIATLEKAMAARDSAEHEALEQRHQASDRLRQADALQQSIAAEQKFVVAALSMALESLAGTDLTHQIDVEFPADYQNLKVNFDAAVSILRETMRTISSQANSIFSVTGEISNATDDLSKRTEQQAMNLEETASALDQITANVKQTAAGVSVARNVIENTKSDAERSSEVVRHAVSAMDGIQQSSEKIGQITSVINEIAFQTNLLALNAGVEAARAGDAGRGFAVVASEVRALAQRSADASKEINTLIATSRPQVEEGVKLVGETGTALGRILTQVAEITDVISNIAKATEEQAIGLTEVNTAINHMDQFTQQNAAMVEQSAAAGQSLARETGELTRLISRFHIDGASDIAPIQKAASQSSKPNPQATTDRMQRERPRRIA